MHHRTRRVSLILGAALMALALAVPAGVAAHPHGRVVPADVLGEHIWAGALCDGTAVTVRYHVTDRGRPVFDEATGAPTRVGGRGQAFHVRFVGTRTRVMVSAHWFRGTLHLHERSRIGRCDPPPPPPDEEPPPDDGGNGPVG